MHKIIAVLLFALLLPACQPYMTYEELEADAKVTGDSTRLDKFEDSVVQMEAFYENKAQCFAASSVMWVCKNFRESKRQLKTLDDVMRVYRREKSACACYETRSLRNLF